MSKKVEITRRKLIGGVAVTGAAAAATGAGTMAYFSEQNQSQNNTVKAGNIDLTTNGNDSPTTTVSIDNVAPGDSGSSSINLNNQGSIDGFLSLEFSTPAADNHIVEVLRITVKIDGKTVRTGTFDTVFDGEGEWSNADFSLQAQSTKPLTLEWALPPSAGNDVQNQAAKGDITIHLNQQEEAFADLVVDAGGGGNVTTIQEGVNDTPSGGVVLVRDGTYNEAVTIDKADLKLASKNGAGSTKIKPSAQDDDNRAVEINGVSGVTIDGFDITFDSDDSPNSEKYAVRARAASDGVTVRNCSIGGFSTSDNADGAVRATGITITSTKGPGAGNQVDDPIVENNVFENIKCVGGTDSTDTDNDSKAKGVALNGNVVDAKIVVNEFLNIGSAGGSGESPNTEEPVTDSDVNGTEKPRGISLVENSGGTGPRNFTILQNTFDGIVGTWGQPSIFVGGLDSLGSDHEVYDNEFHHPVDNLSSGVLRLRNNTWVNDKDGDGMPELVAPDADNDGGNLIDRAGGSEYDTTYAI